MNLWTLHITKAIPISIRSLAISANGNVNPVRIIFIAVSSWSSQALHFITLTNSATLGVRSPRLALEVGNCFLESMNLDSGIFSTASFAFFAEDSASLSPSSLCFAMNLYFRFHNHTRLGEFYHSKTQTCLSTTAMAPASHFPDTYLHLNR